MNGREDINYTEDFKIRRTGEELFHTLPVGAAILKGISDCQIEAVNEEFFHSLGYSVEELLNDAKDLCCFCYGEDWKQLEEMLQECQRSREEADGKFRFSDREGIIHCLELSIRFYGYQKGIPYFLAVDRDISTYKKMEEEIRLQKERHKLLEELTEECLLDYDVLQDTLRISERMQQKYGFKSNRIAAAELAEVICENDREKYWEIMRNVTGKEVEGAFEYQVLIPGKSGKIQHVWHKVCYKSLADSNGEIVRVIGRTYDIDKDKKFHRQLREKARRDSMTQLLNKQALREEIEEFFEEEPQGTHAFMVIDIDNFKKINDTFGHVFGDTIIREIAGKIREQFRGLDIIGRVGGDEFVVCMKYTSVEHAGKKAHNLCESVRRRCVGNRAEHTVTCSVGIAFYGEDGEDYETLFRKADMAMYQAKVQGKNGYRIADKKPVMGEMEKVQTEEAGDKDYQIVDEQDQDFLAFTFELLSRAKDIEGSINILLERIGKRYHLNLVYINEYKKSEDTLVVTNCWASSAVYLQTDLAGQSLKLWEEHGQEGRILIPDCNDGAISQEDREVFREMKARAFAEYRYGGRGKPSGFITFCDCEESREWTDFEEKTFSEIVRMISVFVMLRTQREEDQNEIRSLQDHDPLTGLYNQNTFKRKAERILRISEPEDIYAFVCADMSGFSYINENFGYEEGDQVLRSIAEYLQRIPNVILASRRYADLFLMMVKTESKDHCIEEAIIRSRELRRNMKKKYPNGNLYESTGIYFWNRENCDIEEFIENANIARKEAKRDQEFWLKVYTDTMKEERNRERIIAASFYPALGNQEFDVYLQPKFLLDEWRIYGAEALVRWRRLDGRYHNPNDFIPVLEKLGYINDLDFYVFEEAVKYLKKWNDDGKKPLIISTNFSGQHFKDLGVNFVEHVCEITERYGVPNRQLEIEITESVAVQELNKLQEILEELRRKGFRIAIDDFGTGYSSLNILFDIPVDVVKIDKSFLNSENFQKRKQLIIHIGEMVRLADEDIIFEGIEEKQQVDFLLECGYRYGQGYIFDKPIRVLDFEQKYLY